MFCLDWEFWLKAFSREPLTISAFVGVFSYPQLEFSAAFTIMIC